MTNRDILLIHENMRPIIAALEPANKVHCLWAAADSEDFLTKGPGQAVRVVVTAGDNRIDPSLLQRLPQLRLIACVGSGYSGIDVDWCMRNDVAVIAATGVNADDVADYALGLAIAAWRGIVADDQFIRGGSWLTANRLPSRRSMKGNTAGIVGFGAIGRALAPRLAALGMDVRWWGPRDQPGAAFVRSASLLQLARDSRLLVICCRADVSSTGMIDREVIDALGPEGVLVNVSRGSVVDETALVDALRERRLGQAALDVFATEPTPLDRWADVPNVILTPHSAGLTVDTLRRMIRLTVDRIDDFFSSDPERRNAMLRQAGVRSSSSG